MADRTGERGSTLVMAAFVLVMLTGMGIAILFSSRTGVRSSQADLRSKKSFYIAEGGLEAARERLRTDNLASADPISLDDELVAAAGANGQIDFNPATLKAVYDAQGRVTGFSGYGDDVPVLPLTSLGAGSYASFLANDAIDGRSSLNDTNDRLQITAIGAGTDRSLEVVDAVVRRFPIPTPPATITLLGPTPHFDGGSSNAKTYVGTDCYNSATYTGVSGLNLPVVGVVGSTNVAGAQSGVRKPSSYFSGTTTGIGTVQDVATTIDPNLLNCSYLRSLATSVRAISDYVCTSASPCSHWGSSTISTVTFVDGALSGVGGKGILWVTGNVTFRGNDSWDGVIFVVGTGSFQRNGGGNGQTYGGTVVANIAGPDGVLGNGDDCSGAGSGFGTVTYDVSGGGNHDTVYCSDAIAEASSGLPLKVASFRER